MSDDTVEVSVLDLLKQVREEGRQARKDLNGTLEELSNKLAEHEKYWGVLFVIGKLAAWFVGVGIAIAGLFKGIGNGGP